MNHKFDITREEFEFLMSFVPSYAEIAQEHKLTYLGLCAQLAAHPESVIKFRFLIHKNAALKVPVIKAIRQVMQIGLKEAKDIMDSEQIMILPSGVSKEYLLGICKSEGVIVDFIN